MPGATAGQTNPRAAARIGTKTPPWAARRPSRTGCARASTRTSGITPARRRCTRRRSAGREVVVKNLIDRLRRDRGRRTLAGARRSWRRAPAAGSSACERSCDGARTRAPWTTWDATRCTTPLWSAAAAAAAIVDALFDDVRQSATPVTHFANPRTPRRPHPVAVRDLGGRTPAQLCRIGGQVAAARAGGGCRAAGKNRRGWNESGRARAVPSVLPAEWARRARRWRRGSTRGRVRRASKPRG